MYHRARGYDRAVADRDVFEDDGAGADEDVVFDANGHLVGHRQTRTPVASLVFEVRDDRAPDPDRHAVTNLDAVRKARIDQRPGTDPGSLADSHTTSTVEGRPDRVAAGSVERDDLKHPVP